MSLEMKKQLLQELMDMMDDNMMSRFKKPGKEEGHEIEMSKMKVDGEELPTDIEVDDKAVEDEDKIDPEMLKQLIEMSESKDDKEGC